LTLGLALFTLNAQHPVRPFGRRDATGGGSVRDIVKGIAAWRAAGVRFAVATVVRTWSSAHHLPARYIGAMGSRRTHHDRLARLRAAGVTESAIARLSSPIGLDLGARTPQETAVAIAAENISLNWGGTGLRLTDGELAIHR
jgi:xanthine/CO dehydrogenase XdhC/CoxF family maturation factor